MNGVTPSLHELIDLRREAVGLKLVSRSKSSAPLTGNQRSNHRGRGVDFEEVRIYQPGDDIRTMDWRVTARTGHPHTKLFREERERLVYLLVDLNPSMAFGTRNRFKSVAATHCAALLGWAATHRHDRVGGLVFTSDRHREFRPLGGTRGLLPLLKAMTDLSPLPRPDPLPGTTLADSLIRLRRIHRPGSQVFVISDFRTFEPRCEPILSEMARHGDAALLLIHDPLEANPPVGPGLRITNGQGMLPMADTLAVGQVRQRFAERVAEIRRFGLGRGIPVLTIATDQPLADTLRRGLHPLLAVERHVP